MLNALFLAAMVLGLRIAPPPIEDRPIEVELVPAFIPQAPRSRRAEPSPPTAAPSPAPLPKAAAPPRVPAPVVPRPSPPKAAPAPPAPVAAAPAAPPRAAGPTAIAPPVYDDKDGRFRSGLRIHLGCADPDPFRLTPGEQQVCGEKLAEEAKTAKPLTLEPPEAKDADYQRKLHCRQVYGKRGIPSSADQSNAAGGIGGLGYVPSLKECPPEDR